MKQSVLFRHLLVLWAVFTLCPAGAVEAETSSSRPNILFCISDDQSWLHAGPYGCEAVATPAMDRLAATGVRFNHAYCAAPSCAPSRAAVLTGQEIWRLEQGANLWSRMPAEADYPVYTRLLESAGYQVGFTGKGWWPGHFNDSGWDENPAGKSYNQYQEKTPCGVNSCDYARNFQQFLDDKSAGRPFCFWYGCYEPHRIYKRGIGREAGMEPGAVDVPGVFPDTPEVKNDILDYLYEIQRYDQHLGRMVSLLEEGGMLENTLIVITSDNGMPFPRAKANLYDLGTRLPLIIAWKGRIKGPRVVEDMVSLTDMAPTFLEVAGVPIPKAMTGKSLLPILETTRTGLVDQSRTRVFMGRERHAWVRLDGLGYPSRAIRTPDYLYIRNFSPDRWPAGHPNIPHYRLGRYGDIDDGPTKALMQNTGVPAIQGLWKLATGKRPAEELYDVRNDPEQVHNLAWDSRFQKTKEKLESSLMDYLRRTGDPRATDAAVKFDTYHYYGPDVKPK